MEINQNMGMQRQNLPSAMGAPGQQEQPVAEQVTKERLREWMRMLQTFKTGKANLENRVIASENWWKLRNTSEENWSIQVVLFEQKQSHRAFAGGKGPNAQESCY